MLRCYFCSPLDCFIIIANSVRTGCKTRDKTPLELQRDIILAAQYSCK